MARVQTIRILLADNHVLFRKGLTRLLDSRSEFAVVGEAENGPDAVQGALRVRPHLVLMDYDLPLSDGPESARCIKRRLPQTHVIILGQPGNENDLIRAIQLGADGYLLKDIRPDELFTQLRRASEGIAPLSPALAGHLFRHIRELRTAAAGPAEAPPLSPRETEVAQLVASGRSNREIAARLAIAENTVKNHVRKIMRKLEARNRAHAAAIAVAAGIVRPPSQQSSD